MSPRCWLMNARSLVARQKVFFSSPPTASTRALPVPDGHRQRRESAGATDRHQDVAGDTNDRVVARRMDLAIVHQEAVAEVAQPRDRIVVEVGERFAGEIAARHHERGRTAEEQQVVHRRRRQHDPEQRVAGSDELRDRRVGPGAEQHDRSGRGDQLGGLGVVHLGEPAGLVEVGHHHRERLVGTSFATPQTRDGGIIGCVAGEVVSAETLDPDGSSAVDRGQCRLERVAASPPHRIAGGRAVVQHRPAVVTSDRLGVVPPVGRIVIFRALQASHMPNGAIVVFVRS